MARTSLTARARDRVLNDEEIRALWRTLEETPYPLGRFVQLLLLLTAQRRDEVAQMRWSELDSDVWVIPRERYKSGRANAVPLSEPVQRILSSIPRTSEYVSPPRAGRRSPASPRPRRPSTRPAGSQAGGCMICAAPPAH